MKNSKKFAAKIEKQNQIAKDSFEYPSAPMKSKSDRGFVDYFARATSEFERTLRSNKAEVARRIEESRILTYEEQVERSNKLLAIEREKRAEAKRKNSEEYKLEQRNKHLVTKEGAAFMLATKYNTKHIVDEKGNVVAVKIN